MTPAQALALRVGGLPLPPMALVTVDGGGGYWNPHPGDNPQAMLTDELIPLCQRKGLGTGKRRIGVLGISMGGYGAMPARREAPAPDRRGRRDLPGDLDQLRPGQGRQRRARTPRRPTSRPTTRSPTPPRSRSVPVRVASGYGDPFYPGVQTLARALPRNPGGVAGRAVLRQRLPHRPVLHRPGTPVPRVPGPPPHDGLTASRTRERATKSTLSPAARQKPQTGRESGRR